MNIDHLSEIARLESQTKGRNLSASVLDSLLTITLFYMDAKETKVRPCSTCPSIPLYYPFPSIPHHPPFLTIPHHPSTSLSIFHPSPSLTILHRPSPFSIALHPLSISLSIPIYFSLFLFHGFIFNSAFRVVLNPSRSKKHCRLRIYA